MLTNGEFYKQLTTTRKDSPELKACMENIVAQILSKETSFNKPGVLLGKIQSGKTRAFIGVIALVFDNEYDVVIVLTKGTIALAEQTYKRLKKDFKDFVDEDQLKIYDILHMPDNLPKFVLQQKLVVVSKKQTDNLAHVMNLLEEVYPDLAKKRVLIIDDEADFASIGFHKDSSTDEIQLNKIASQIDALRLKVKTSTFLQVTATPYSLYLQPEEVPAEYGEVFMPKKPAFTVLLPTFRGYVGGDFYFGKNNELEPLASYVYEEVEIDELEILHHEDRRSFKIEDAMVSNKITMLRKAIMNFIVGTCIRRIQQTKNSERLQKYSFVVHTEHSKVRHDWQEQIVNAFKEQLTESARRNLPELHRLIKESFDDLRRSLVLVSTPIPLYAEVESSVINAINEDYLIINKVNSEQDVHEMLDDNGQLMMMTPLNIFIGGQILDRGLTIENLIGFYYGRRPNKYQQDTVLQHSRMYGNRKLEDLAVTRFYTAPAIYEVMKRINEFDLALRQAFEKGAQNAGVVFIRKDSQNKIKPCSPNKIMLSSITTLVPFRRLLPVGFQTDYKTKSKNILDELDGKISECQPEINPDVPFLLDLFSALWIIDIIDKLLIFEDGFNWDISAFKASMEYLSKNSTHVEHRGKVWCLIKRDRNLSRMKGEGFSDAPDTATTEGVVAKKTAKDIPILMLFRQNGLEEQGWRGLPFWWPVLMAPENTRTVIFASDFIKEPDGDL